ncbi:MAG: CPBP family intramembrane glutamic endopeptidase [Planctomycetota bacterium]|nr:CPBP family intramembrane glutamic endopeptidase [Planctomycetota bacterium]
MGRPDTVSRGAVARSYALASTRPLHVLVFLTPLLALYELGSMLYLSEVARGVDTIGARGILASVFENFGVASLHVPPIALSVVLIAWHLLLRDPWRVRARVVGGMAAESALWALPLLVFSLVLARGAPAMGVDTPLAAFSWQAKLTVSIGAGVYEELLFRLLLITGMHFLLVDVFRIPERAALVSAGVASAVAFTLYHNIRAPSGALDLRLVLFYGVAGAYFAGLFITRGFGIVVATHAVYDIVALLAFDRE